MAFDPRTEDYERMALRYSRTLDAMGPLQATRALASFGQRYARERDALPQMDADRSFHLVAEAAGMIDYELPFVSDEQAETLISRAHELLDEALIIDPQCHDAARMLAASDCPSFESYYRYLAEGAAEVRASCEHTRAEVDDPSPERAELAADLAMRPYIRWLATLASKAPLCGRNREAIRLCEELLALDPSDAADARWTCMLAYAKLEDDAGLEAFATRTQDLQRAGTEDAWLQLARMALAYKRHDIDAAHAQLRRLHETYEAAARSLTAQRELPDGVFARLAVPPFSEDELILALSEATVLLQEGRDDAGRGVLGTWVAEAVGLGSAKVGAPGADSGPGPGGAGSDGAGAGGAGSDSTGTGGAGHGGAGGERG
jgi:hypothetical protein